MPILLAILLFPPVFVILICARYTKLHSCCYRRSTDFFKMIALFKFILLQNISRYFFSELTF